MTDPSTPETEVEPVDPVDPDDLPDGDEEGLPEESFSILASLPLGMRLPLARKIINEGNKTLAELIDQLQSAMSSRERYAVLAFIGEAAIEAQMVRSYMDNALSLLSEMDVKDLEPAGGGNFDPDQGELRDIEMLKTISKRIQTELARLAPLHYSVYPDAVLAFNRETSLTVAREIQRAGGQVPPV